MAVLDLVEKVLGSFECKEHRLTTFCDLSKAFDCVSHDLLVRKLAYYKFDSSSINLIKSYLENRSQRVCVDNRWSDFKVVNCGVPQGSVLGPLLFLVYINDLPQFNYLVDHILYADDTTLSSSHGDIAVLWAESCGMLSDAKRWFTANGLKLNDGKTAQLLFSLRDCGELYSDALSTKFLGVYIDNKLKWDVHIDALANRLKQNIFLLRGLSGSVGSRTLKTAYFSLCHSLLSYAILAWGQGADWTRIFALQRRAVRVIAGLGYRQDCRVYFTELKILTFPSIYIYQLLVLVKENIGGYPTNNIYHEYNTRNGGELQTPFYRLSRSQKSVYFLAPKYYNKLPVRLRELNIGDFKKQVRTSLIGKAYYSYNEFLNDNIL